MGCPPEVFVRPVTMDEGRRLQRIGRTARDPVELRRVIVVLMSAQGQSEPDITHLLDCSPEHVRTVIDAFNESRFAALDPRTNTPRSPAGQANNLELVFLPTCASWLNWIESEFAALRYFALGGTGHRTHAWQGEMIDRYIRWRNARAQLKTSFAPNSVIRTWTDYQINVA